MATRPTKSEVKALVLAYAKKMRAQRQNPPMRIQQRLHDAFSRRLERLCAKYPEVFPSGYASPEFFAALERAARIENGKLLVTGSGCDW